MKKRQSIFAFVSIFYFFSILFFLYFYASLYDQSPPIKTFLDREGRVIGSLNAHFDGIQYWVPYEKIPQRLVDATIAREDRYFFWHHGINPFSITKALWQNITHPTLKRGGSTITQQLAKNLIQQKDGHLSQRTYLRKLQETALAFGLELRHSKTWILERYLNSVYYGHRCYGVGAAALTYFSKSHQSFLDNIDDLTDSEIATLSSLPRSPSLLSQHLSRTPLAATSRHFMEWVAASNTDTVIKTTLDLDLQKKVERALSESLRERSLKDPKLNAAAMVIDVRTGDVLAMVGSRDYFNDDIQGAVNAAVALRQPGSTLKPFTYFAAFTQGLSPETVIPDQPTSFYVPTTSPSLFDDNTDSYQPQNFDRRFHGDVTIREALANSYNVPAVVTLNQIGLSYYHDMLKRFGFTSFDKAPTYYGLSITLGSAEVSLLELTNAYAALARGGNFLPYRVLTHDLQPPSLSIHPKAYRASVQTTSILADSNARLKSFGFNDDMHVDDHEVAVKTGTSYDHRDNWTISYTPAFAVGVWVGHADGSPLDLTTGASGAAPVWHAIMEAVLRGTPSISFPHETVTPSFKDRSVVENTTVETKPWTVTFPLSHAHYRDARYLPADHQSMVLQAKAWAPIQLSWYLDGVFLGDTTNDHRLWIQPTVGKHLLTVKSQNSVENIPFTISGDL